MSREAHAAARSREIDALRGAAAIMVVAFHGNSLVAASTSGGLDPVLALRHGLDLGVELFFVVSGYLVGGPFIRAMRDGRHPARLADYAMRRAARILPAYWLLLLATLALEGVAAGDLPRVALHAVLLHGVVPGQTFQLVDLAWTLSVEALFYVAMPLAALAVLRLRPRGTGRRPLLVGIGVLWLGSAVLSAAVASRWGTSPGALLVVNGLPGCIGLFAPGMALAAFEGSPGAVPLSTSRRYRHGLVGAGLALVAMSMVLAERGSLDRSARNAAASIGFGLLLAAVVTSAGQLRARLRPVVTPLAAAGTVSYGIYLWHSLVATIIRAAGVTVGAGGHAQLAWLAATALLLLPTLVIAILSWTLVEKPVIERAAASIRARRDRRAPSLPSASATAAAPAPLR